FSLSMRGGQALLRRRSAGKARLDYPKRTTRGTAIAARRPLPLTAARRPLTLRSRAAVLCSPPRQPPPPARPREGSRRDGPRAAASIPPTDSSRCDRVRTAQSVRALAHRGDGLHGA